MTAGRNVVDNIVEKGDVVSGISTGFGLFAKVTVPHDKLCALQENLIRCLAFERCWHTTQPGADADAAGTAHQRALKRSQRHQRDQFAKDDTRLQSRLPAASTGQGDRRSLRRPVLAPLSGRTSPSG